MLSNEELEQHPTTLVTENDLLQQANIKLYQALTYTTIGTTVLVGLATYFALV